MTRREHDAYYTEEKLTAAMLRHIYIPSGSKIVEPCNGGGDITRILTRNGHDVFFSDLYTSPALDPNHTEWLTTRDATKNEFWDCCKKTYNMDYVVTNPPFTVAHLILPKALEASKKGVVFLLRLSYLEPVKKRATWLKANPAHTLIIPNPRPSFTNNGKTDNVTVAWIYWKKDYRDETRIIYDTTWKAFK